MVLMQKTAISLLWQDGDEGIPERARELSEIVPRVFVVDRRASGEAYSAFSSSRLHYAPFRQKLSLGIALNRALCLAYEEGIPWLWILEAGTRLSRDELRECSAKASAPTGLYVSRVESQAWMLFQRPPCALLVSVAVARSLGGWDPVLPTQFVLADFEERLLAAGGVLEKVLSVEQAATARGLSPRDIGRGLWIRIRRRFFAPGTKSR
jgi:hypothetical protein